MSEKKYPTFSRLEAEKEVMLEALRLAEIFINAAGDRNGGDQLTIAIERAIKFAEGGSWVGTNNAGEQVWFARTKDHPENR